MEDVKAVEVVGEVVAVVEVAGVGEAVGVAVDGAALGMRVLCMGKGWVGRSLGLCIVEDRR